MLLEQLPADSRLRSAVSGDNARGQQQRWGQIEFLLADVCDEIRATNHLIMQIAGGKPPQFTKHPRPYGGDPEPESASDQMMAMMNSEQYKFLRQHLPGGPGADGPSQIKLVSERTDKPGGGSDG